jgi:hypothetical protein
MQKCNYNELINSTFQSHRQDITGLYFYDSSKNGWCKILKATWVFTSFQYVNGTIWADLHHTILESKKVSSTETAYLMNCSKFEYNKLRA